MKREKGKCKRWGNRARAVLIAAAASSLFEGSIAFGQTVASWVNPVSGTWGDALNWSTNPFYPDNGSPAGTTYAATVGTVGSSYLVDIRASTAITSLQLNSPDATVQLSTGTLTVADGISVTSGTLTLQTGTIQGGTIEVAPGGTFVATGPTASLSGVTLKGLLTGRGNFTLRNGFAFDDGTIRMETGTLSIGSNQVISGTGTIIFDAPNRGMAVGTATFGPDIKVLTGTNAGTISTGSLVINQGLISSRTSGQTLNIVTGGNNSQFANQGTLEVKSGATLSMSGTWTNSGTFAINGGTLLLTGTISGASIGVGRVVNTGGTILLSSATIENATSTLDITGLGATKWDGATVNGGTIISSGGQHIDISTGTFSGVNLGAEVRVSQQFNDTVKITSTLHFLPGGRILLRGTDGSINFVADSSSVPLPIDGTGEIVFDGLADTQSMTTGGRKITIGPNVILRTGAAGGTFDGTIINQGTISAQTAGKTLNLARTTTNYGTVIASNGGILTALQGAGFSNSGYVVATGGGLVRLPGILQSPDAFTGTFIVGANSTIIFGPGSMGAPGYSNQGTIVLDGPGATFNGWESVYGNTGKIVATNGATVSLHSSANSGSIIIGPGSTAKFDVSVTFLNSGTIDLNSAMIVDNSSGPSPFNTIRNQVISGYHNGSWDGIGINSTSAAADSSLMIGYAENSMLGFLSFGGMAVDQTSVLLKLTSAGDADLDGLAELDDFQRFLNGYQNSLPGWWINGDFDYSGTIGIDDDFAPFLYSYFHQGSSLFALQDVIASSTLSSEDQDAMLLMIEQIPEPGAGAFLALAGTSVLRRRRRR